MQPEDRNSTSTSQPEADKPQRKTRKSEYIIQRAAAEGAGGQEASEDVMVDVATGLGGTEHALAHIRKQGLTGTLRIVAVKRIVEVQIKQVPKTTIKDL